MEAIVAFDDNTWGTPMGASAEASVSEQFGASANRLGYRFVKRAFDIVFSGLVIAVGFIPSLILSAVIVIDSPGAGPIYAQTRVGKGGKEFKIYKFRSMVPGADEQIGKLKHMNEATGPLFKIKEDPRVTRVGRFIRKHSIDELPQFLNVFAGQLSCVGPRPPLPREVKKYGLREWQRLSVKSGLSGYWQVSGRSDMSFENMMRLDLQYIEEASFATDMKVIARTIGVMINGDGAC